MKIQEFRNSLKKQPIIIIIVVIFLIIGFVFLILSQKVEPQNKEMVKTSVVKDIGISVGGVEQQAYIERLEKNYYDFEDRVKNMENQVKKIQTSADHLSNSQKEIVQSVLKLDQDLGVRMQQRFDEFNNHLEEQDDDQTKNSSQRTLELSVANIAPTNQEDWVYLPIGSFCKGTLLTGVYAAADMNNPLPVLISLDEAFYGPNKSRVPLKGAFVLGKAYGDLVSQRALIQIVAISSVLPSGYVFENEQELGYVTDESGELGIKGQIIYSTGRQLALSFMGGFVSGGAQAIADSQVTTHKSLQGDSAQEVTGSPGKAAAFSGLAQSAGKLSEYYQRQAEDMVPAIHIKNGAAVFFIVQKGVTITGLARGNRRK